MAFKLTTLNNQQDIPCYTHDIQVSRGARYVEEFTFQIQAEQLFGFNHSDYPQLSWYDVAFFEEGTVPRQPLIWYYAMLIKLVYSSAYIKISYLGKTYTVSSDDYTIELRNCSIVISFSTEFTTKLPLKTEIIYQLFVVSSGFNYMDLGFSPYELTLFVSYYPTLLNLYEEGFTDIIMTGNIINKGEVTEWL